MKQKYEMKKTKMNVFTTRPTFVPLDYYLQQIYRDASFIFFFSPVLRNVYSIAFQVDLSIYSLLNFVSKFSIFHDLVTGVPHYYV